MRTNPRFGLAACAAFMPAALAFAPAPAAAHGLSQRADLPIPAWLFGWAAAAVLVLSFAALGALWSEPKLERPPWRPLPDRIGRVVTSRAAEVLAGAFGVLCLVLVVWTGLAGVDTPTDNLAPTLVYVVFWVGLVPVSVLFGDVFRALNPWRAIGRAAGALSARVAGGRLPAPLA